MRGHDVPPTLHDALHGSTAAAMRPNSHLVSALREQAGPRLSLPSDFACRLAGSCPEVNHTISHDNTAAHSCKLVCASCILTTRNLAIGTRQSYSCMYDTQIPNAYIRASVRACATARGADCSTLYTDHWFHCPLLIARLYSQIPGYISSRAKVENSGGYSRLHTSSYLYLYIPSDSASRPDASLGM